MLNFFTHLHLSPPPLLQEHKIYLRCRPALRERKGLGDRSMRRTFTRRASSPPQTGGSNLPVDYTDTSPAPSLPLDGKDESTISLKLQIEAVVWKRDAHQPGGPPLREQRQLVTSAAVRRVWYCNNNARGDNKLCQAAYSKNVANADDDNKPTGELRKCDAIGGERLSVPCCHQAPGGGIERTGGTRGGECNTSTR